MTGYEKLMGREQQIFRSQDRKQAKDRRQRQLRQARWRQQRQHDAALQEPHCEASQTRYTEKAWSKDTRAVEKQAPTGDWFERCPGARNPDSKRNELGQ
ncbi:MAG: hypothetical protein GXP27_05650 [Planctomycetes bacterium]|nr:hypothetical protein [Planctomycetota bacterium]